MRKYCAIILLIFSFLLCAEYEAIIYLKDGSVIHGTVIEEPGFYNYIKVKSGDKVSVYQSFEIDKITRKTIGNFKDSNVNDSSVKESDIKVISKQTNNDIVNLANDLGVGYLHKNCYSDGVRAASASRLIFDNVVAPGIRGFASSFSLGLIGTGISYAVVFRSNPHPVYIPGEYEGNCQNDYVQGYKKEALRRKKLSNLLGSAIGFTIRRIFINQRNLR